jgi:hypothetical protein
LGDDFSLGPIESHVVSRVGFHPAHGVERWGALALEPGPPVGETVPQHLLVYERSRYNKLPRRTHMKVMHEGSCISAELMAELQEAADKLARGERDQGVAKQAAQRMDRMREENRRLFGVQDIGIDIIRQMRDSR